MPRFVGLVFLLVAFASAMALMHLTTLPAEAQAVSPVTGNEGKIISGSVPPDGNFGLVVYGGGTYDQLVTASGCPMIRVVFWATRDGSFVVYVPGSAVAAPNADFLAAFPQGRIPANTGLIGRCTPGATSGIQGTVTIGPLCHVYPPGPPYPPIPMPVEDRAGILRCPVQPHEAALVTGLPCLVYPPGPPYPPMPIPDRPGILPCPDQPYQATLVILDSRGNQAARVTSGADGRYRVVLPPGPYTVVPLPPAEGARWPLATSVNVTVPPGVFIVVDIHYDSGIRYLDPVPLPGPA